MRAAVVTTSAAAILLFAIGAGAVSGAPQRSLPFLADYRGQTTQNDGKHFPVQMLVDRSKREIYVLLIKEYTCPDGPYHFLEHEVRLDGQGAFVVAPPVSQHLHMTAVKGRLAGTRIMGSFVASRRGCHTTANFIAVLGGGAPLPPRPGSGPASAKKPWKPPYPTGLYQTADRTPNQMSFRVVVDRGTHRGRVQSLVVGAHIDCNRTWADATGSGHSDSWSEDVTEQIPGFYALTGSGYAFFSSGGSVKSETGDDVKFFGTLGRSAATGSVEVSRESADRTLWCLSRYSFTAAPQG